ncbi:MAG TPA: EpsI family protein [Terriglobales bacterium]|jgi:EpsI family protein
MNLRFLISVALLAATGVFLWSHGATENNPGRLPLSSFPTQLNHWTGSDIAIGQDVLDVLGAGDFMLRNYRSQVAREPYVNLFIAYFPSQRTGDTIHSPKNCLPGAGWRPLESSRINLELPGHEPFQVNRYIIAKGPDRQLVLYWYLAHDRAIASEYWAKYYLVADSIRLHRSDGSLIRVTTPLQSDEEIDVAQQRLISLSSGAVPVLNQYVPR